MHIAVDKGANPNSSFEQCVNYLEVNSFISSRNRTWVDKIRQLGNHYVHRIDEATEEDAKLVMIFIRHLLSNVYELPAMAQ
jgi:hypothetical protein